MYSYKKILKSLDYFISRNYLEFLRERKSLLIFTFHGLFKNEDEIEKGQLFPIPHAKVTVEKLKEFIEYFKKENYKFISPEDITRHSKVKRNLIMITFDDGYYNNINALSIMEEYKIPAVFFISTDHVEKNKCFWWDVLYREGINRGKSIKEITKEIRNLKNKKSIEIEEYMIDKLGLNKKSLLPKSDIDRPFSPTELLNFSKNSNVFLGNHTKDHAILTNYSKEEIKDQILSAQNYIYKLTGVKPKIISYPNGVYSLRLLKLVEMLGLKIGLTGIDKKNHLPLSNSKKELLKLGRFTFKGDEEIKSQCVNFRSDISIGIFYKRIKSQLEKRR